MPSPASILPPAADAETAPGFSDPGLPQPGRAQPGIEQPGLEQPGLWQQLGAWWLGGETPSPPLPTARDEPLVELACGWDAMPVFVLERPVGQPHA